MGFCEDPTMVLVEIKDFVRVGSGSMTLITHKNRGEDLKKIVEGT